MVRRRYRRGAGALRLLAALLLVAAGVSGLAAGQGDAGETGGSPPVHLVEIDGAIGPATALHLSRALEDAAAADASLVVLRIDTPGGLATAMRDMVSDILASQVPVASFVAPEGARAASAGTYILYASHVAAMAPTTHLGAATPVSIGGGGSSPFPGGGGGEDRPDPTDGDGSDGDETSGEEGDGGDEAASEAPADPKSAKAINDSVAYIRALAERRGRNADWAEKAVREAASLTSGAALERGVIDLTAADVGDLLAKIDGRVVTAGGEDRTLETAGARVETVERSTMTAILEVLSNPNVALLLMTLGFYGIVFELANPGFGPGIFGAISLLLGLFALNQLPVDYAGLALLGLGLAFMAVEAFSPSFGVFGVGGAIAFGFGAWMLIDTDQPAYQISPWLIVVLTAISLGLLAVVLGLVWRAQRRRPTTGQQTLIGTTVRVLDWSGEAGSVRCRGERWRATGEPGLAPGDTARVTAVDGLTLRIVRTADDGAADSQAKETE